LRLNSAARSAAADIGEAAGAIAQGLTAKWCSFLLSAALRPSRLGSHNPLRRRTRRLGSRNRLRRRDRRIVIKRRRHKPPQCRSQSYTLSHRLVGIIVIFNPGIAIANCAARAHISYLGRGDTRRKRQGSCSEKYACGRSLSAPFSATEPQAQVIGL
jgi:hypothetical protein